MKKFALLLFVVSIGLASCKKYDEGGLVSKAEENIVGTWMLGKYLRNGADETSQLILSNYKEVFTADNKLTRSYIDEDSEYEETDGTYAIISDGMEVKIDGVSSVEMTENSGTISASSIEILQLTETDFWYTFENGGDSHEIRLKK